MDRRAEKIRVDMAFKAHLIAGGKAEDFRPEWVADHVGRGIIRGPKFPPRPFPELAELFGIWTGDGSLSVIKDYRPSRRKTYEKICFTVTSGSMEVLERTKELIHKVIGAAQPTFYRDYALHYCWCHTFVVETFLFYGAVPGRKPKNFAKWYHPKWIEKCGEWHIAGLAECDGCLRIIPEKGTYLLWYSRNIVNFNAPGWVAEEVISYGYYNERVKYYEAPPGAVSYKPEPPPIIEDEARLLRKMGFSVTVRAERFFAKPGEQVRVKWEVEAYGLEPLVKWLLKTRPVRLSERIPELVEIAKEHGISVDIGERFK